MQALHSPTCSAKLLPTRSTRPRLYRGFGVSADWLCEGNRALRQEQRRKTPRCTAAEPDVATERQVLEHVNQSGGVITAVPTQETPKQGNDWQAALQILEDGSLQDFQVTQINRGGVCGQIAGIEAFMPFSKLSSARGGKDALSTLVGRTLKVKAVTAQAERQSLVVSEQDAIQDLAIQKLKPGDVVTAVIKNLVHFGAFAIIKDEDTGEWTGGEALLHISDMSWDHVPVVSDIVSPGTEVKCKVKVIDKQRKRISLSMKLMEDDPLNETLDKLFSVQLRDSVLEVPVNVPQGVKDICKELEKEEGIDSVVLGRQAEERRVVSQDLELWISKEVLQDGFVLITRAGRTVQELKVTTKLPVDGIKAAVQKVLQRLA